MKKILLLFSLVLNILVLHGMQSSTIVSAVSLEVNQDEIDTTKEMKMHFKNYLANRLQECSKTAVTRTDASDIQKNYEMMINKKNSSYLSKCLHRDVVDGAGNTFAHVAIKNKNLFMIKWVMSDLKHPLSVPNKEGKEPIDLCIEYLMPAAQEDKKDEKMDEIFDALTLGYEKADFDCNAREKFLNKIVELEFTHTKYGTDFALQEDILKRFTGQDTPECIQLSKIYQSVCDEDGNTYTHILVLRHLADVLHTFIAKGYITFAKNKNQKDPLILAAECLSRLAGKLLGACAPNKDFDITKISQEDKERRCCYIMLANVLKKQKNQDFKECCPKHVM